MSKTGLGKGLSALIPVGPEQLNRDEPISEIEIALIKPNPFQPRRVFNEEKLVELADSIKEHGVVQPIVVRKGENGKYELVVGERRLRACQIIKLKKIPAVIKEFSREQMMEIALVENIQRQDLNPVEEAKAYKRLMEEFNLTQEQIAQRVSKSRPLIANMVRLLHLPGLILDYVAKGELTIGHARPLLAIDNEEGQIKAAVEIISKHMSVREVENYIKKIIEDVKNREQVKSKLDVAQSPLMKDIEERLRSACGTKVKIKDLGNKGKIEIDYYNTDDLERIVELVTGEKNA